MENSIYDIHNYNIQDLLTIFDLKDFDEEELVKKTKLLLDNTDNENEEFILEAAKKLLLFIQETDKEDNNMPKYVNDSENKELENNPFGKQLENWSKNQYLKQDNQVQADKVTSRNNKVNIFDNQHNTMKRERLGITNNYDVPVSQGTLNPLLKNINTQILNIDSQYRNNLNYSSSIFSLNLTEPINNALSLTLRSYEIPFSWYNISSNSNNNHFTIDSSCISISNGFYTRTEIITAVNDAIIAAGKGTGASLNTINGLVTLNGSGPIVFYDSLNSDGCSNLTCGPLETGAGNSSKENFNLGHILGFRNNTYPAGTITGESTLNIYTTKYILLYLDDYNKNQLNNGLVGIGENEQTLSLPSYFNNDLSYNCASVEYSEAKSVQPSAPRRITQAQIYSINEIIKSRKTRTNNRYTAPNNSNILAKIPIKYSSNSFGNMLVEDKYNDIYERKYFGPVDIEKMKVSLLDDKGNVLDLNGNDWSITLSINYLYQY
jgi:hypothetical protein